jgi:hypothetical protein
MSCLDTYFVITARRGSGFSVACLIDCEPGQSQVDAVTFKRSLVGTKQPQPGRFEAACGAPVSAYDAPPRHSTAEPRHHMADLPWSAAAHDFGDVSVRRDLAWC